MTEKFIANIKEIAQNRPNGTLHLKTINKSWKSQKSCILSFYQGTINFGDTIIPNNQEFSEILRNISKSDIFDSALSVANKRIKNHQSSRELSELLIQLKVLDWKSLESWVAKKIILNLELFASFPGEYQWQDDNHFDLLFGEDGHGFTWSKIEQKLDRRRQQWHGFSPTILDMNAIPAIEVKQLAKINDPAIKNHLLSTVNGQRTLLDIAEIMAKDPLKVAKTYFDWFNNDWITFLNTSESDRKLPVVLSLDDSAIVQTTIKRALKEKYRVLLANKAEEALKILKQDSVGLLLLDLTLPDLDGLEFCKQIRKIPKLKKLPIIMVTGRDGLVDRAKGRFAGTDRYLTKPFKPEELRQIVSEYI